MSSLFQIKKYLSYRIHAVNEHGIHSPFVFKLYCETIKSKGHYYAFGELDNIRRQLLHNNQFIEVTDLGAGSKKMGITRSISAIAKNSLIQKKYAQFLFRLVNYIHPRRILELGTSLGLSALYMWHADKNTEITTLEGCPGTHAFASELFTQQKAHPIKATNSSFDDFLSGMDAGAVFDLVYIDGNHTYEATIRYFNMLLPHCTRSSILVFDDIYWSEGMAKAWKEIKNHPSVTVSMDIYQMGIIFFRKENKEKEHFILKL